MSDKPYDILRVAFACCACDTVILVDHEPVHQALKGSGWNGMQKIAQGVGWALCDIVYEEKMENSDENARGIGLLCPDCTRQSLHLGAVDPAEA